MALSRDRCDVSVVIPAYNGEAYLGECLSSVFEQTLLPREIIVIDDGSSDNTPALARQLIGKSPLPMRVEELEGNSGGPARPMNVGVKLAAGRFISVVDQDDVLVGDRLARLAPLLGTHPEVSVAFSESRVMGQVGRPPWWRGAMVGRGRNLGGAYLLDGPLVLAMLLGEGNVIVGYPGFVFRRDDWLRRGGADEGLRIASDYDMLCWLCRQGSAVFVPRPLYHRREHGANASTQGVSGVLESARIIERHLRAAPDVLRDPFFRDRFPAYFGRLLPVLAGGDAGSALRILAGARQTWGRKARVPSRLGHMAAWWVWRRALRQARYLPSSYFEELGHLLWAILNTCRAQAGSRRV